MFFVCVCGFAGSVVPPSGGSLEIGNNVGAPPLAKTKGIRFPLRGDP